MPTRHMHRLVTATLLCMAALPSHAMLCPNSYGHSIQMGDNIKSVLAACGNPEKTIQNKPTANESYDVYIYQQNALTNRPNPAQQYAVVVHEKKVTAIRNLQQPGVTTNMPCQRGSIHVGASVAQLFASCGRQSPQKHLDMGEGSTTSVHGTTILQYRRAPSLPTENLVFKNDKLVSVVRGGLGTVPKSSPMLVAKKIKGMMMNNTLDRNSGIYKPTQTLQGQVKAVPTLNNNSGLYTPNTIRGQLPAHP